MLRITDARTGGPTAVGRTPTRVHAHVTGADTSALRVLLVADVLARALELDGSSALTLADPPPELASRAAALGIRPAETAAPAVGRALVLHVAAPDAPVPEDGVHVAVAPVAPVTPAVSGVPAAPADGAAADDSVLRYALLACPRPETAEPADLADEARDTLARWRRAVAAWAARPSRPVPEPVLRDLRTAWEDDLDVLAVLAVLRRVERDDDLPDGARFETFAYADRLLGLELARDVGASA